jgi:hypothetical protein
MHFETNMCGLLILASNIDSFTPPKTLYDKFLDPVGLKSEIVGQNKN